MLRDLVEAGFQPNESSEAGTRTQIKLRFEKIRYIIGTQNVVPPCIQRSVRVKCETTFNNMNKALFNVYKVLIETLPKFLIQISTFKFYTFTRIPNHNSK